MLELLQLASVLVQLFWLVYIILSTLVAKSINKFFIQLMKIMLFIPGLMGISYITLPSVKFTKTRNYKDIDDTDQSGNDESTTENTDEERVIIRRESSGPNQSSDNKFNFNDFIQKILALRVLLKYMIPLFLVI